MTHRVAAADVSLIRQTTQFTCCAASITSALHALGKSFTEEHVNKVLGAAPMAGATWEAMLATVQYFGCRGTLVVPATPRMLKSWTDQGIPVVIAWNPEGRPWSHASVVFDVQDRDGTLWVSVMDPNIPNPSETVRTLDVDTFCQKWGEKVSDTLIVRRPAMAVTLEVSANGHQVAASTSNRSGNQRGDAMQNDKIGRSPTPVPVEKVDPNKMVIRREDLSKPKIGPELFLRKTKFTEPADTRYDRGHGRRPKHRQRYDERDAAARLAAAFLSKN